ncbi:MAG TPA: hypothetical protein PK595_03900 [Bacteroidota bacterium]|nr:hypothetical protein [Bacteroidota bacterium]
MPKYFCSGAVLLLLLSFSVGCSTVTLKPADFAWPVEVVLKPDTNGFVKESRFQVSFNIKPLLFEEFKDSVNIADRSIRLIRDLRGYYFITGKAFKHVYVFGQADASLKLEKKILVSEKGLEAPALNQKNQLIELIDEKNSSVAPVYLSKEGIQEGGKK